MKINAVIPIRYSDACFEKSQKARYTLKDEPLWVHTFQCAVDTKKLSKVIVAYDDERFESHLEKWQDMIKPILRPSFLSLTGTSTLDVLGYVSDQTAPEESVDYWMLMEITHPLRPKSIADRLIEIIKKEPADSLITVHPVRYNFWLQNHRIGTERIVGGGEESEVQLFQELIGICSIFSTEYLGTGNPFGERVDMVPIEDYWSTIDVRDDDGLWLAQKYLERIKNQRK